MSAALETRGLTKSFGGVRAVRGVDFRLESGQVHALLGENGAGKSTFVGMLSGILSPDSGEIVIGGEAATLTSPVDAQRRGLRTVHQELELAGPLTVAENILLGRQPARFAHVDQRAVRTRAIAVLDRLGANIDPAARVETLSVADQQVVEIARAIAAEPRILFLDEPTAALAPPEIERLMAVLAALKSQGVAILYISHRLDEVLRVADHITVLRDGSVTFSEPNAGLSRETIVTAMLGAELAAGTAREPVTLGETIVEIEGLTIGTQVDDVGFTASRGEVVGFFGLAGGGQMEIAQALFGIRPAQTRSARVLGLERLPNHAREAIARGMAYVPADRKREGLALGLSIADNLLMTVLPRLATWGIRSASREAKRVDELVERFRIKASSSKAPASSLSGGNQQKIVLGSRTATGTTDVLILCEPTRGVDVGAKAEIYRLLRGLTAQGATCLLFSSDGDEVAAVCDRAYVVRRGRIASSHPAEELSASFLTSRAL